MCRARALLTLLVLALASLAVALPATAGGPTSVLLSAPGQGRVAALHHTDADYGALGALVGLTGSPHASTASPPPRQSGEVVTLTWLIHDVQVWRIDRVHLGDTDRPWVETRHVADGAMPGDAPAVWHRADGALPELLARVLRGRTPAPAAAAPATEVTPATPAAASTPGRRDEPATSAAPAVATWATAGLVLGVVLTLLAQRVRERRRAEPVEDPPATVDQLAWP